MAPLSPRASFDYSILIQTNFPRLCSRLGDCTDGFEALLHMATFACIIYVSAAHYYGVSKVNNWMRHLGRLRRRINALGDIVDPSAGDRGGRTPRVTEEVTPANQPADPHPAQPQSASPLSRSAAISEIAPSAQPRSAPPSNEGMLSSPLASPVPTAAFRLKISPKERREAAAKVMP